MYPDLQNMGSKEILRRMLESGAQPGSPYFEHHRVALDAAMAREAAENSVKSARLAAWTAGLTAAAAVIGLIITLITSLD